MSTETSASPQDEATRLFALAQARGLTVRLLGGVAVALAAGGPLPEGLQRVYKDLDYVVARKDAPTWALLLEASGYIPDVRFNSLHGSQRLLHYDTANSKQLDTFVGEFAMCHVLNLERRFPKDAITLAPVDLLLTKLQIVEVNDKDLVDTVALLLTHDVGEQPRDLSPSSFAGVVGADWGWYTTITDNLAKVAARLASIPLTGEQRELVRRRVDALVDTAQAAPKSIKWRARSVVGRRMPWYDLPEEVDPS
ncbi:MAG: hypothetical protein B7X41_07865 [Microbacterium sp. 14-71-5]|jgi:hypothetical protein|nr:MAG: hypothetical protein B7X41_07865 [Microbacterium sp. 14-71-5]